MKTVTIGANSPQNLFALVQTISPSFVFSKCSKLQIQLDPSMGAAKLRVGNSDISSTNCGTSLVAGQAFVLEGLDQNRYHMDQLYLLSDTVSTLVNIAFVAL